MDLQLQFHLEAFELMMIYMNKKVDHASSPRPSLPPFILLS